MEDLEVMLMVNENYHRRSLAEFEQRLKAITQKRKGGSRVQRMSILRRAFRPL